MKEAVIALKYDCFVLNVTRPDPIGYLYLSVSIPKIVFIFINLSKILLIFSKYIRVQKLFI